MLTRRATALERYELAGADGQLLQESDTSVLTAAAGSKYMVRRADLLHLLESSCRQAELLRGVTVQSLVQDSGRVTVTFDDGSRQAALPRPSAATR